MDGFLAETVIPSLQHSSLLLGWQHFTGGLQSGSPHGGGQTGLHGAGHDATGAQGTAQTGAQGSSQGAQHRESEHPTMNKAAVAKKSNVAKNPSCFFI
jgi:hypothetical protein